METSEIVKGYEDYLTVKYPTHYKSFSNRLKNNAEGARAEAVIFSLLRPMFSQVIINEDKGTGGADFLCITDESPILLEVTSLSAEATSRKSGWQNEIPEDVSVTSFELITHTLRTKASDKAGQVSGKAMPTVVVITSEHIGACGLLGPYAASHLMTGTQKIRVTAGGLSDQVTSATHLKDAVFFRFNEYQEIELCRESISAILLVQISSYKSCIVGLLHPAPVHPLLIRYFPEIPFIRIRQWPLENGQVETEWVIHSPEEAEYNHQPIQLTDNELKNL